MIFAEMMAARCEDAAFGVALKQTTHRDVQGLTTHMLAYSNQLIFRNFFLYLFHLSLQFAFLNSSHSDSTRQHLEIEIRDISLVSLEVRIISEVLIELISS